LKNLTDGIVAPMLYLAIQLGGKIQYFGEVSYKPTIGDRIKEIDKEAV